MPSQEPPLVVVKKRKIPFHKRISTWYLKLRFLNKIAVWLVILSAPMAFLGYKVLKPIYKDWKQRNALALAAASIEKKDDKAAVLAFRRAILAGPKNPEVWKQLGAYLERKKSPERVWVWDRLTQLQPEVPEYRYKVARAALEGGDWQRAQTQLAALPEKEQTSRDYAMLSAQAFVLSEAPAKAEAVLVDLLKRQPNDEEAAFRLSQIQAESQDPAVRMEATRKIRELAASGKSQSTEALRQLAFMEAKAGNNVLAASDAAALLKRPDATINDHLLFLELEFVTSSFTLPISIDKTRQFALEDPQNLRPVVAYLIRRGMAVETLAWLDKQPPEKLDTPEGRQAQIDLAIASRDWNRAYSLLEKAEPPVAPEVIEKMKTTYQAFRADKSNAVSSWGELAEGARDNLYLLGIMEQLAAAWDWPEGREKVLWAITEVVPGNVLVWKELLPITLKSGNTPQLLRVLSALTSLDPSNRQLRNTWLSVQFLLQKGDSKQLLAIAEEDAKASNATDIQLVYAVMLADAGDVDKAVAVADKIPASARENPRTALYLSYVYAKAKKPEIVKELLAKLTGKEKGLLGEELALAERSKAIAEERPENQIPLKASGVMDEESANRVLQSLEGERADMSADRQRLLEQLKSQPRSDSGANDQLKRLRQEMQNPAPAATPAAK